MSTEPTSHPDLPVSSEGVFSSFPSHERIVMEYLVDKLGGYACVIRNGETGERSLGFSVRQNRPIKIADLMTAVAVRTATPQVADLTAAQDKARESERAAIHAELLAQGYPYAAEVVEKRARAAISQATRSEPTP